MRPRLVDWSLLLLVVVEALTGLYSFLLGRPENWPWFALHGGLGLGILLLLFWKLRRVWRRLAERRRWDQATTASVAALASVLLTIGSGVVWTTWQRPLGYPNGLNWHVIFGLALTVFVVLHTLVRFKPLRGVDLAGRRNVLAGLAVLATGGSLWAGQQGVLRATKLPGAQRRFTGSRAVGLEPGPTFPVTMWMFDNPAPYDLAAWKIAVTGAVAQPLNLALGELAAAPLQGFEATLDCTGGWYTTQLWNGVPVGWLLAQAQPKEAATGVSFVSATGYRWSMPLDEAQGLMLATHVGGVPLGHGHGAPLRLVAPGRRGFQWVKWVKEIRVLDAPDWGQWGVIFTSGVDG